MCEMLPHNGETDQPCEFGCLFCQDKDKIKLVGDCRSPYSNDCYFNKRKERPDNATNTNN